MSDYKFITPSGGTFSLPVDVDKKSTQYNPVLASFFETFMKKGKAKAKMDNTDVSTFLTILGIIKHSKDSSKKISSISATVREKSSTTDVGQITDDGSYGIAYLIQKKWPDEKRDSKQLKEEIIWFMYEGLSHLKTLTDEELLDDILFYIRKIVWKEKEL